MILVEIRICNRLRGERRTGVHESSRGPKRNEKHPTDLSHPLGWRAWISSWSPYIYRYFVFGANTLIFQFGNGILVVVIVMDAMDRWTKIKLNDNIRSHNAQFPLIHWGETNSEWIWWATANNHHNVDETFNRHPGHKTIPWTRGPTGMHNFTAMSLVFASNLNSGECWGDTAPICHLIHIEFEEILGKFVHFLTRPLAFIVNATEKRKLSGWSIPKPLAAATWNVAAISNSPKCSHTKYANEYISLMK